MKHPHSHSAEEKGKAVPSVGEVVRRIAPAFAIFSVVLLSLLLLSWFLLLPRFTRVKLNGMLERPTDVERYVDQVKQKLAETEEKRQSLVLPLDPSPYGLLAGEKVERPSLFSFQETLQNIARSAVPGQEQAVILLSVRALDDGRVVELAGDVRNVGLNSMAVLSQFVDMVEGLPSVSKADRPEFTREQDPSIGFHSPFTFRLSLK